MLHLAADNIEPTVLYTPSSESGSKMNVEDPDDEIEFLLSK